MSLEEDLDLTDIDVPNCDRGNDLPAGWYAGTIDDIHEDLKSEGTLVLVLKVEHGSYAGTKLFERLWGPRGATDPAKAKKLKDRRAGFAKRLGLITDADSHTHKTVDWETLIGTDVAMKVVRRKREDGSDQAQLDWMGLYLIDNPYVPAEIRRGGNAPSTTPNDSATAASTQKPPRRAKIDYSALGDIPL